MSSVGPSSSELQKSIVKQNKQNFAVIEFIDESIRFGVNLHSLTPDEIETILPFIPFFSEEENHATIVEEHISNGIVKYITPSGKIYYRIDDRGIYWDNSDPNDIRIKSMYHSDPNDFSRHGRLFRGMFISRASTDLALAIFLCQVASCLRIDENGVIIVMIYEDGHLPIDEVIAKYEVKIQSKKFSGGKFAKKQSSGGANPSSGGAKPSSGDSDTTHIAEGLSTSFFLKGRINDPLKNNDVASSFLRKDGTYLINTASTPKGWTEGVKTPISVTTHTRKKIPICNVTRYNSTVPLEEGDVLIHVEPSI